MSSNGQSNITLPDAFGLPTDLLGAIGDVLQRVAKIVKNTYEWHQILKCCRDNTNIKIDDCERSISEFLSKKNFKDFAKELKHKNGFEYPAFIASKISSLLQSNGLPKEESDLFANSFEFELLSQIKATKPDIYGQYALEKALNNTNRILTAVSDIHDAVTYSRDIKTYEQMSRELFNESHNPHIDMDYFITDDSGFQNSFKKFIDQKATSIHIKGQNFEETAFCAAWELQRLGMADRIRFVMSQSAWDILYSKKPSGLFLIPLFRDEAVHAIPDNTSIFCYGDDEGTPSDVITLLPRLQKTLEDTLKMEGASLERVGQLASETDLLYLPFKRKVFNLRYLTPPWVKRATKETVFFVLTENWDLRAKDKLFLGSLTGLKENEIEDFSNQLSKGENPLFLKKLYGEYRLVSPEESWLSIPPDLLAQTWNAFKSASLKVIEAFIKEGNGGPFNLKPENYYSNSLIEGILKTYILRATRSTNEAGVQTEIDNLVDSIFKCVKTPDEWDNLASIFYSIIEASPKRSLIFLKAQSDGFCDYLKSSSGQGSIFDCKHYTYIFSGLDKVFSLLPEDQGNLCGKEALNFLGLVYDKQIDMNVGPKPDEIISMNITPYVKGNNFSPNDKIEIYKQYLTNFPNSYSLLLKLLAHGDAQSFFFVSPRQMRYRKSRAVFEGANVQDVLSILDALFDELLSFTKSADRYLLLIPELRDMRFRRSERVKAVLEKLKQDLPSYSELDKQKIQSCLRRQIYQSRFYKNSFWALEETSLALFEEIMNGIAFENPTMPYFYVLTDNRYDFPILHPVPFEDEGESYSEKNGKTTKAVIDDAYEHFRKHREDFLKLLEQNEEIRNEAEIGRYIAAIFPGKLDFAILDFLFKNGFDESVVGNYVGGFALTDYEGFKAGVNKCLEKGHVIAAVIALGNESIRGEDALIFSMPEEVKKIYWKEPFAYRAMLPLSKQNLGLCLPEIILYGSFDVLLECLFDANKNSILPVAQTFSVFKMAFQKNILQRWKRNTMSDYYLSELFDAFENDDSLKSDADAAQQMAIYEIWFFQLLKNKKLSSLTAAMEKCPEIYAEILSIIYKTDDNEIVKENVSKETIAALWNFYSNLNFCPFVDGSDVNYEKFVNWADQLKNLLIKQKQTKMFEHCLGKILACAPLVGERKQPGKNTLMVMEKYYDNEKNFATSFIVSLKNQRGVFSDTAGEQEKQISAEYQSISESIAFSYPNVSSIYQILADDYLEESRQARKRASQPW